MINTHNCYIFTIAGLLFALAFFFTSQKAEASHTDYMSGYAWSENIGWISFNCDDLGACGTSNYKVGVQSSDQNVVGYAWSENIGWIMFDPPPDFTTSLYPEDPQNPVVYNPSGNKRLAGWARACAGTVSGDCNSATQSDWDGWAKMFDDVAAPDSDKPQYNASTGEFEGWIWGSDVMGWISLNCKNDHDETQTGTQGACASDGGFDYAVTAAISTHPVVWNLTQTSLYSDSENFCLTPPQEVFSWSFKDEEDCPGGCGASEGYDLQIDSDGDFIATPPEVSISCSGGGCGTTRGVDVVSSPVANQLAYNTTYYWRVRVQDSNGSFSEWTYPPSPDENNPDTSPPGDSFATEVHKFPDADFTFLPVNHSVGEEIAFYENTTCYDSGNNSIACPVAEANYIWDFEYVSPSFTVDAIGQTATTTYSNSFPSDPSSITCPNDKIISFEVTDVDGNSCRVTKCTKPKPPLPEFKETAPTSFLNDIRGFFTSLLDDFGFTV
jgi:hypothetical protein